MKKAIVLLSERLDVSEKFRVELTVLKVVPSARHPEGVKVSFVLIDTERGVPRLVVDNHAPFGFHVHTRLPEKRDERQILPTTDYVEALDEFWRFVKEIVRDED